MPLQTYNHTLTHTHMLVTKEKLNNPIIYSLFSHVMFNITFDGLNEVWESLNYCQTHPHTLLLLLPSEAQQDTQYTMEL